MDTITFHTEVNGEQVIRPPAHIVLPEGPLEVTVKSVRATARKAGLSPDEANARLRRRRVSIGRATGSDNDQIDADLARVYGNEPAGPPNGAPL